MNPQRGTADMMRRCERAGVRVLLARGDAGSLTDDLLNVDAG